MSDQDQPTLLDVFEAVAQTNVLMAKALEIIQQQNKEIKGLKDDVKDLHVVLPEQSKDGHILLDQYFDYLNTKNEFLINKSLGLGANLSDRLDNVDENIRNFEDYLERIIPILGSLIENKRRAKWWVFWRR